MFHKVQENYFAERKAMDRKALVWLCCVALADNLREVNFTATYSDDSFLDTYVAVYGRLPWTESLSEIEIKIPLNMLLYLKLNVIREYVARKILAGGDTKQNPVGQFEAADYGKLYTSSLNVPFVEVVDKDAV